MNFTNVLLCILIAVHFEHGLTFLFFLAIGGLIFIILLAHEVSKMVNHDRGRF